MYNELIDALNELISETSTNKKQDILKKHKETPGFRDVIEFLTNDFKTTGISTKKIQKELELTEDNDDLLTLLDFVVENNTGKDSVIARVKTFIDKHDPIFEDVFSKNLKLGVSAKTVNKAFGEHLVPVFNVQLAFPYDKEIGTDKKQIDRYEDTDKFYVTQKLDGYRAVTVVTDKIKTYTRKGQEIEGLEELHEKVNEFVTKNQLSNLVLDGELLLVNHDNLTSDELFRQTSKALRKKGSKKDIEYNIFDLLTYDEFMSDGQSKQTYENRRKALDTLTGVDLVKIVEVLDIITKDQIKDWSETATNNGWEGVMLNYQNGKYETKRTPNLLKVKKMHTADLELIGFKEAIDGKFKGGLQSIVVQFGDNTVDVGSGLSEELREEIWKNQDFYLGKIVEIQYFEVSENQNGGKSLRFPVFKSFRFDKTKEDINID